MSARRRLAIRLLAAAIGLAVLAWTIARLGPRLVLAAAVEADAGWLALSVVLVVARYLIWGLKWHGMLRRDRPVPFRSALRMLMAGCFVNLTTPTAKLGGGLLRAAVLHRHHGWNLSSAFGWVIADQMTNVLGSMLLFGLLAVAGGWFAAAGGGAGYVVAGSLALLLFGSLVAGRGLLWKAAQRPRVAAALARMTPSRFRAKHASAETASWVRPLFRPLLRQASWIDVAAAGASFAALCAANAFVLRALGIDAAVWVVAVAVAIGYFAGNGLGPWGGIGVTEAAMAGVYLQLGVAGDAAAAGVLLHRAAYYVVGLVWGGVALLRIGRGVAGPAPPA
jgi:uncharacterized membrane protein YbhN (UPF0104 family)